MNVLILTPDAVGSTLLQRMLTIYMQFHDFDRPVINLHELTNGLEKYYSPEFNREIVSKKVVKNWGYYQTLEQVVDLLGSVDHYKTSRLAHYHIRQRGDSVEQQIPFYNYLNDNFFIIACRRSNVFEHALSMTLNKITKKLNVFDALEKIDTFYEIHKNGVQLDPTTFVNQLEAYRLYINWSDQYFNVASYFNYEQDIPQLERYILNLPVFINQPKKVTWNSNFGMGFEDWNKMHYLRSDLSRLQIQSSSTIQQLLLEQSTIVENYQQHAPEDWPAVSTHNDINNLPAELKQKFTIQMIQQHGIVPLLSQETQQFVAEYQTRYQQAQYTINQMISLGIIINGPPIKKQTLSEKKNTIKNFDQLLELYNQWADVNQDIATPIENTDLNTSISKETAFWNFLPNLTML